MRIRPLLCSAALLGTTLFAHLPALAQDSAFLACARHNDRGQRIACLEDALEAALEEGSATVPEAASVIVDPATEKVAEPEVSAAVATGVTTGTAVAVAVEPSPDERLTRFGQPDTRITTDDEGNDQLTDTIASLEKRSNLWLVTLTSGQVWRQQVSRTFNLREGDEITIYQAGMGNGYRLSATRLSGFIRVERVK